MSVWLRTSVTLTMVKVIITYHKRVPAELYPNRKLLGVITFKSPRSALTGVSGRGIKACSAWQEVLCNPSRRKLRIVYSRPLKVCTSLAIYYPDVVGCGVWTSTLYLSDRAQLQESNVLTELLLHPQKTGANLNQIVVGVRLLGTNWSTPITQKLGCPWM